MRALVYDGKGVILRQDWPAPRRRQNEARVRVLLAGGAIDPMPLIDRVYDLKDGMRAMKHAARRGTLKILLRVSE